RVDEVVYFSPLTQEDYERIAVLMLTELVSPLAERGITLSWDETVPQTLAAKAFGGKRGARDLRNVIRREAEDAIASMIVDHCDESITSIHLTEHDGVLCLA
ncbi:MAG: ATP-dependent Clp protease ATP-binding subunit, partial [Clostridia bacterium]|nr:ATP-dependent Clp protease ATP-binding subunit [Clostridia bacterium]